MPDLKDLAERVENATGPDRELGREVLQACGWSKTQTGYFMGPLFHWSPPGPYRRGAGFDDDHFYLHDPTSSLDAAMTLVPEGRSFEVRSSGTGDKGQATVWDPMRQPGHSSEVRVTGCATPALALCAASLRALSQGGV